MATIAQDNLVYAQGFDVKKVKYPLDTAGTYAFNQGDMLWFDSTAKFVKAADTDAHMAYLAGVALKSSQLSLFVNQNTAAATKNYELNALVGVAGVFFFKTTVGETYVEGTALYIGADAQTITTVAGSHSVGVAKMRSLATSVTGATGVSIDVLITAAYPVSSF